LERLTELNGRTLIERLAVYPSYLQAPKTWLDPALRSVIFQAIDGEGYARDDTWQAGSQRPVPRLPVPMSGQADISQPVARALAAAMQGRDLSETDVSALLSARGHDVPAVAAAADSLRASTVGDKITYVINRNINYTNVCLYRCGFCAFSKGRTHAELRGRPYDLAEEEIARRVAEAWQRGATEVCLQGGIHPQYSGATYLKILKIVKSAAPQIHIHAFSPLEVTHGARTLGLSLGAFLKQLKEAGLASLPGTAAEVLDDEVRQVICPDKVNTAEWLEVMETAHGLDLPTTATVMFGHVEAPHHLARHLLRIRKLQSKTGGFTEFVPLPFVHMEAPIWIKGQARPGPTFREALLMHSVARLEIGRASCRERV
jgi:FO synthase